MGKQEMGKRAAFTSKVWLRFIHETREDKGPQRPEDWAFLPTSQRCWMPHP